MISERVGQILAKQSPNDDALEIERIALNFHHLIGCLLLKLIGYEGHIINLGAAHLIRNKEKIKNYSKIKPSNLLSDAKIQQLINEGKVDEAKEALENIIEALKMLENLKTYIRII